MITGYSMERHAMTAPTNPTSGRGEGSDTPKSSDPSDLLLDLRGIVKRFPGVTAVDHVDFDLYRGEVHVLFGENGSGKSTLVNVIAGTYGRDEGDFLYGGAEITHWTPQQARSAGISPVFQEFSLVPDLTVVENLFLGREHATGGVLQKRTMRALGQKVLDDLDFHVNPGSRVRYLKRSDQQMTEITKALLQDVKLLILDEPTSSLTERETRKLFALIDRLKGQGIGIIYVSHRMGEIRQVGDRITVLRDGKKIATVDSAAVEDNQLVEMMTGRQVGMLFPPIEHKPGPTLLEVKGLTVPERLENVSLYLRAGEITGIAGLAGEGKSLIARAIFGLEEVARAEIRHSEEIIQHPTPQAMLARGVFYCPPDRAAEGLALPRPVRENASVAALDLPAFSIRGFLRRRRERREVKRMVEQLQIRPPNIERTVKFLSGGNQQKVLLLRGLSRASRVFLFDDPTVGVDVGAKKEVYLFMKNLIEEGAAVLFVSSELPELLNLCNRLYVAHGGRIVAEFAGDEITEENVLRSFFGSDQNSTETRMKQAPTGKGDA